MVGFRMVVFMVVVVVALRVEQGAGTVDEAALVMIVIRVATNDGTETPVAADRSVHLAPLSPPPVLPTVV